MAPVLGPACGWVQERICVGVAAAQCPLCLSLLLVNVTVLRHMIPMLAVQGWYKDRSSDMLDKRQRDNRTRRGAQQARTGGSLRMNNTWTMRASIEQERGQEEV